MVKPPRIRHSKPRREPVTIDLDASEVKPSPEVEPGPVASPAAAAMEAEPRAGLFEEATAEPSAQPDSPVASDPGPSEFRATEGGEAERAAARMDAADAAQPQEPTAFGRTGDDARRFDREPPPRAAEPAVPQRPRRASTFLAGVAGGLLVLLVGLGLHLAGLLPGPSAGGDAAAIAELRAAVASLDGKVAAAGNGEVSAAVEALQAEVAALKTSVASAGSGEPAGLAGLDERIARLEQSVADLGAAGAPGVDAQALEARIAAAEATAKDAAAAAAAAGQSIAAIERRLDEIGQQVAAQASNPKVALAIAAAGLKSAIDRGAPFMTELETYAAIAPDAPEIAALRQMAAAGVATRADIAARSADAAVAMIEASAPAQPNAGILERLFASLQSVIKVRPVGEVEGEGVGPTAARIEAAIKANDYQKALAEYETLPEASKAAGAAFIADVKARQSADELVEKALAGALRA